MGKGFLKKLVIILVIAVLIIAIFFILSPPAAKEAGNKINEVINNIGETVSKDIPKIFNPSNKPTENNNENKTPGALGGGAYLAPTGGSEAETTKLYIYVIYCTEFIDVNVTNDGLTQVDFSNSEFYHSNFRLGTYTSNPIINPGESKEVYIYIPRDETVPLTGEEPWIIDMILKDNQNTTTFSTSFPVNCA